MKVSQLATGAAVAALALAGPAGAIESPPTGLYPSVFATQYGGCLGQLRSTLAKGFPLGPFAQGFGPGANPGVHQGTVGEEEFLVIHILPLLPPGTTLEALCAGAR
jgi:hypothetical protein